MVRRDSSSLLRTGLVVISAAFLLTIVTPALAQTAPPTPPNLPPGAPVPPACGWNPAKNSTEVVSSSPAGSAFQVTIGEPSWEQDCLSYTGAGGSTSSSSFVAYEVFPLTVHGPPNTSFNFQVDEAIPSPAQVAEGVRNTTIWAFVDPWTVVTDSSGVGVANFTLAGAVMPFVPNDIANVTLPILASSASGNETVGLPIEFEGGVSTILQAPGPVSFENGIAAQAGGGVSSTFNVVYMPFGGDLAGPLPVSFTVVGSYQDGSVGPMPQDIQVSFPQQSFVLQPNSILYYQVEEANTVADSSVTNSEASYTFAIQESVGNSTYIVPLAVSVSQDIFEGGAAGLGTTTSSSGSFTPSVVVSPAPTNTDSYVGPGTASTTAVILGAGAVIAVVVVLALVGLYLRSRRSSVPGEPPAA